MLQVFLSWYSKKEASELRKFAKAVVFQEMSGLSLGHDTEIFVVFLSNSR